MKVNKLSVDSHGKVTGICPDGSAVRHNSPWPCRNGDTGGMSVPSGVLGMLVHTMVSDLPSAASWFNQSQSQASAHFGVAESGEIWQFGPVNGWKAWHASSANPHYFGVEFADAGNPAHPLTQAQIAAGAQLLELLSRPNVGNFPMQICNTPGTEGLGWHGMGGQAYGGHFDCPGDTRKNQRPAILSLAQQIRAGGGSTPTPDTNWTVTMISELPTLKQGDADKPGEVCYVHRAQALLAVVGQLTGVQAAASLKADGNFGSSTLAAVNAIQAHFGIPGGGGEIGSRTWSALVTGNWK